MKLPAQLAKMLRSPAQGDNACCSESCCLLQQSSIDLLLLLLAAGPAYQLSSTRRCPGDTCCSRHHTQQSSSSEPHTTQRNASSPAIMRSQLSLTVKLFASNVLFLLLTRGERGTSAIAHGQPLQVQQRS